MTHASCGATCDTQVQEPGKSGQQQVVVVLVQVQLCL